MHYVDPVIKNFLRTNQPEGRGTYVRLDQNENPDGIPMWLFEETMKKITPSYLSLYPEEIVLKEKYASLLGVQPENVTLTDGSVVAMGYVIKVFGEPRKKLICATPTFGMYKVYADMSQMETVFVHYNENYSFDIDRLLDQIDDQTSLVSLVNPNMPIGNVYSQEDIEKVVQKASENDALVIIDEAYHYFYDKNSLELLNKYENVVILRTFSKMLSIPGLRLGAVISTEENIQYINNYKPHYTVNGVALAFGEAIVDNFARFITEMKETFFEGKEYITRELEHLGYSFIPSEGCFLCITPKCKTAEEITAELKDRNILIFCGKGDSAGFLRVTVWGVKYMKMFIAALKEIDR